MSARGRSSVGRSGKWTAVVLAALLVQPAAFAVLASQPSAPGEGPAQPGTVPREARGIAPLTALTASEPRSEDATSAPTAVPDPEVPSTQPFASAALVQEAAEAFASSAGSPSEPAPAEGPDTLPVPLVARPEAPALPAAEPAAARPPPSFDPVLPTEPPGALVPLDVPLRAAVAAAPPVQVAGNESLFLLPPVPPQAAPLLALTYNACSYAAGGSVVCGPAPVPLGMPIVLNVDDSAATGPGGGDVAVQLLSVAPPGLPGGNGSLPQTPPELPGFADEVAAQAGAPGAGMALRVQALPDPRTPLQPRHLPAMVWVVYRLGEPGEPLAKEFTLGVDGTLSWLPELSVLRAFAPDWAALEQGRLLARVNATFADPGPTVALAAGVADVVEGGGSGTPTTVVLTASPGTDLRLEVDAPADGASAELRLGAAEPTRATAALSAYGPGTHLSLTNTLDRLPTEAVLRFTRLSDGLVLGYHASGPLGLAQAAVSLTQPSQSVSALVTLRDVPADLDLTLRPGPTRGSATVAASGPLGAVDAFLLRTAGGVGTTLTAGADDLPSSAVLSYDFDATPKRLTWDANGPTGPLSLALSSGAGRPAAEFDLTSVAPYLEVRVFPDALELDARSSRLGSGPGSGALGVAHLAFASDGQLLGVASDGRVAGHTGDHLTVFLRPGLARFDLQLTDVRFVRATANLAASVGLEVRAGSPRHFVVSFDADDTDLLATLDALPSSVRVDLDLGNRTARWTASAAMDEVSVTFVTSKLGRDWTAWLRAEDVPASWSLSFPTSANSATVEIDASGPLALDFQLANTALPPFYGADHLTAGFRQATGDLNLSLRTHGLRHGRLEAGADLRASLETASTNPLGFLAKADLVFPALQLAALATTSQLPTTLDLVVAAGPRTGQVDVTASSGLGTIAASLLVTDSLGGTQFAASATGVPAAFLAAYDLQAQTATVTTVASGSLASASLSLSGTAPKSPRLTLSLLGLAPVVTLRLAEDVAEVEARSAPGALPGSASLGALFLRLATDGALLPVQTGLDHVVVQQTDSVVRADLRASGLRQARLAGDATGLQGLFRLDAPRTIVLNVSTEGVGVSGSITSVPQELTLHLAPALPKLSWVASAAATQVNLALRLEAARPWDASLALTGVPAQWELGLEGGTKAYLRGLSGAFGDAVGWLTNHGTATTYAQRHASIVVSGGGDLDASFRLPGPRTVEVEATATGFRAVFDAANTTSVLGHAAVVRPGATIAADFVLGWMPADVALAADAPSAGRGTLSARAASAFGSLTGTLKVTVAGTTTTLDANLAKAPAQLAATWDLGPSSATLDYRASDTLGPATLNLASGAGKARLTSTLASVPPYLRLQAVPNKATFDARWDAAAPAGSADVGAFNVALATDGTLPTGLPAEDHFVLHQPTASATRLALKSGGASWLRADFATGEAVVEARTTAPRAWKLNVTLPAAFAVGTVDDAPAGLALRLDTAGRRFTWEAAADVGSSVLALGAKVGARWWNVTLNSTGLPARWELEAGSDGAALRGLSGAFGTVRGTLTNHGTVLGSGSDHLSAVVGGSAADPDLDASFRLPGVALAEVRKGASSLHAALETSGGAAPAAFLQWTGAGESLNGNLQFGSLPRSLALTLDVPSPNQGTLRVAASGNLSSVSGSVVRTVGSLSTNVTGTLVIVPASASLAWVAVAPSASLTYAGSGPLGGATLGVVTGAGRLRVSGSLSNLPPWVRLSASLNRLELDARASEFAPAGSASLGTVAMSLSTDHTLPATSTNDHAVLEQSSATGPTRFALKYTGPSHLLATFAGGNATLSVDAGSPRTVDLALAASGASMVGRIVGVPRTLDLVLDGAKPSFVWTASAALTSANVTVTTPSLAGRVWKAWVDAQGIPAAWRVAKDGERVVAEALSGAFTSFAATLTNHGTVMTSPGNHANVLVGRNGDLDLSLRVGALSLAEVERLPSGFRGELRLGAGSFVTSRFDLNGVVGGLDFHAGANLSFNLMPAALAFQQEHDQFTFSADRNFKFGASSEIGYPPALATTAEPSVDQGLAIRGGKTCSSCGVAFKADLFLYGFPKEFTLNATTRTFRLGDLAVLNGTLDTFTLDVDLVSPGLPRVDVRAVLDGLQNGTSLTFGPLVYEASAGVSHRAALTVNATKPLGTLDVDFALGDRVARLEVSNLPAVAEVELKLVKGAITASARTSQVINRVFVGVRANPTDAGYAGAVTLLSLPTQASLTLGRDATTSGAEAYVTPRLAYLANADTLSVDAEVKPSLFGGDATASLRVDIDGLGNSVVLGLEGNQFGLSSDPPTDRIEFHVQASWKFGERSSSFNLGLPGGVVASGSSVYGITRFDTGDLAVIVRDLRTAVVHLGLAPRFEGSLTDLTFQWTTPTVTMRLNATMKLCFAGTCQDLVSPFDKPSTLLVSPLKVYESGNHLGGWHSAVCLKPPGLPGARLQPLLWPHPHGAPETNSITFTPPSASEGYVTYYAFVPESWGVPSDVVDVAMSMAVFGVPQVGGTVQVC